MPLRARKEKKQTERKTRKTRERESENILKKNVVDNASSLFSSSRNLIVPTLLD
jgi:hypothetical protein